ncbi:hypothetical protein [Streptomyces celluloflavus]|uniref:hypothetical protein n=1 Tax=Streptomyces celluloflavus TaxID=58344 RepID=UPI0036A1F7AB
MRKAAQAVGTAALAAILLGGCGSGDTGDGKGGGPRPESASPDRGAGTPAGGSAIEGAWEAKSAHGKLILAITHGTVALSDGHKTACLGTVQEPAGVTTAVLKCTDGDTTRTRGTLRPAADGRSLSVSWQSGPAETYTKSTDGSVRMPDLPRLPSGVPDGG